MRSCDNITIAPPLLKELEASTDPLPYQLWNRMVRGNRLRHSACWRRPQLLACPGMGSALPTACV